MEQNNSELIDPNIGLFSVLGLVTLPLNLGPGYEWQGKDLNSEEAIGTAFYAYQPKEDWDMLPVASVIVANVSGDPSEPDISILEERDVADLDSSMKKNVQESLENSGRTLVEWMSSQLNKFDKQSALITAYISNENGKDVQNIAVRMKANEHKIVVIGTFNIDMKDSLANPIFNILRNVSILD